ncbi:response regulator transcription factor [Proteinivorax hydrogeniformans]|uniref:Stage 0 sporulation protein A homolog n=1 Tax=Proteinivorax hydrogeniformans TaxID=1826727 RepID=A0AAU8HWB0_9FIRM
MKILVVDDEKLLVKGLAHSLEKEGFEVECAFDGAEARERFERDRYDLVILDLMLPKVDGLTLCQEYRKASEVPIIMLTAKGDDIDKILGLEFGADDYMTKPFNTRELMARIKAILRRAPKSYSPTEMNFGDIKIVPSNRQVLNKGEVVEMTAKEFDLITLLAAHPGRVYTRENLLEMIWGYQFFGDIRTVDVHVRRIREKIECDPASPKYILTKWGVGYFFGGNN